MDGGRSKSKTTDTKRHRLTALFSLLTSSTNGYLLVQIDILDSKHLGLHRFLQELLTNSSSRPWQADQALFASSTDLFVDDSLQL